MRTQPTVQGGVGHPTILVKGLCKSFQRGGSWLRSQPAKALDGFDLEVPAGSFVALRGANGSGKSTLLSILATAVSPDAGQVRVLGHCVTAAPAQVRSVIALARGAERSLYDRLTVHQNLAFVGRLLGLGGRALEQEVDRVLELVGLRDEAHVRAGALSTGMAGRALFARALIALPPVLLVDEVARSLDVHWRRVLCDLARDLAREGHTVLWATHQQEVLAGAERVVGLDAGRSLGPQELS